jgi:hypothetical protein
MQFSSTVIPPIGVGWLLAFLALVVTIILLVVGQLEWRVGALIAAALLSRLLA